MAPTLDASHLLGLHPAAATLSVLAILIAGYAASTVIYNLFFSPLRHIPGPKLWAISQLPYSLLIVGGDGHNRIRAIHDKYGDVVRIAPSQVVVRDPRGWKQVMGHRKAGGLENQRDPMTYALAGDGIIGTVDSQEHGRQRRILSHSFSAQSLLEQQPLIQQYVDLLMQRLSENCQAGARALDMTKWYNWTTFDVIGDLAFGEPFGCLQDSSYHPWVSLVFAGVKDGVIMAQVRRLAPSVERFFRTHLLKFLAPKRMEHVALTHTKVAKRMAAEDRPDFMRSMLAKSADGEDKLTLGQIRLNASLLIIAGSETTATALSGATFLLGTNPEALAKVTAEVRTAFTSEDEITLISVQKLQYMLAVLDETMRLFPPVPGSSPRVIHEGGEIICDAYMPEGTTVNMWQWAMYRSSKNFTLPDSFIPERWLGDARFAGDRKEALQPFAFGPRNCIGRNLAYAEMRLILARILWNFDLKLAEPGQDWIGNNNVYTIWEKEPLLAHLTPRKA